VGIIEQYLDAPDVAVAPAVKSRGLIQQYLDAGKDEKVTSKKNADPKPPISGISKEASDELNATRAEKHGGENPRRGILSVPTKALSKGWDSAKGGVIEAGQGLGEALSGKPASGIGKVGMGALSVAGSPWEAASSVASDLTGNETFGNKVGLGITGAVPVAGGINAVAKKLPKNRALSELVDKITSGGRNQQALVDTVNAMKADPRIGPADTSPAVRSMTQKLFTTEGDVAKNYLYETSKARVSKLGDDVTAAFDEAAGTPVNVVNKLNELSASAKKAGSDIINPAITGAGPVNISKSVDAIDEVLKPGIWKSLEAESTLPTGAIKTELKDIRAMLANKKEMQTDAETLHKFQYKLRERASDLLKSTVGSEKELGRALMNVRNNVVNDIDAVSPKIKIMKDGVETEVGQYKHGLNTFREEKDLAEAFREGYKNSAKGMEKDPAFTKKWFDELTDYEKEAAREGKRLSISHAMGRSENPSLAGTKSAKSDFDRQELEIFFGEEGTEKLLRDLSNTRRIKDTDQKITEGSQTQMRAAGDSAISLPVKDDTQPINKYALPLAITASEAMTGATGMAGLAMGGMALAAKGASAASHAIKTKVAKERNAQIARYALPTEGPSRDELIKALEARIPGPKQSLLTRGANSLSRIVSP
jgi:hypothetical protein